MSMGQPKIITLAYARARWDELKKQLDSLDNEDEELLQEELMQLKDDIAEAKKLVNKLEREAFAKLKRG
jgi:hypothetical protein